MGIQAWCDRACGCLSKRITRGAVVSRWRLDRCTVAVTKTGYRPVPLKIFLASALIMLGCARVSTPSKDAWFVNSWNPSTRLLTVWHNGNVYVAQCNTSDMLLNHDSDIPVNQTALWDKS